jgi:tRNA modification GTPase
MPGLFDTIVAPITGMHRAAVTVVRVSGPDAWEVARAVFPRYPEHPEPGRLVYGCFVHGDDGYAVAFAEGASFTGERSAELSVHGSPASVRLLLEACLRAGARPAEPGEFTQRAFLHGRIDLVQAEAVRDTVDAATEAQLRSANAVRSGELSGRLAVAREATFGALAAVEAATDFGEEIGGLDREAVIAQIARAASIVHDLLATAHRGRILREGLTIALVGRPNVGKSSLLNRLLGHERAIVTEIPGTTRDTVEEWVDLGGVPCRLVDTAGLRETDDPVERIGVERTRQALDRADLIWHILAADEPPADEPALAPYAERVWTVVNKIDLVPGGRPSGHGVSALTGEGLEDLVRKIAEQSEAIPEGSLATISARHRPLLESALEGLQQAERTLREGAPDDLAAVGLYAAVAKLGEITGDTAAPDVISRIFRDFCIGK